MNAFTFEGIWLTSRFLSRTSFHEVKKMCPPGWQGNGYSCQDVDECATNNGGCSTSPSVPCLNTMGSFHCGQCPPGLAHILILMQFKIRPVV